jgi:choice-of-anchor C domain-containing protein
MGAYRALLLVAAVWLLAALSATGGGELPSDAAKQVKEFEAEAEAIQKKADAEILSRRLKLIDELQKLAKAYAQTGEVDAAGRIRERVRQLKAIIERSKNLLVNGSFEEGPALPATNIVTLEKDSTAIKGWVVTQGDIDLLDSAYWQAAEGKRSLDMNGVTAGGIAQTFKTKKGQKYRVTFALAGNPGEPAEKRLQVSAAGKKMEFTFDATGKTVTDMGWVTKMWDFTAEGDETTLEFMSLIEGNAGPALDDVMVVPIE